MNDGAGRWRRRMRALLGLPREYRAPGVRYRERTSEPLARALSPKGSGSKAYEARFADGAKMTIHCTRARIYDDLASPRSPAWIDAIEPLIRPGMRIAIYPGGTGALADRIASLVGPSGAIVSIEPDAESVRYAGRRYPREIIAFERGTMDALEGETDGAFDAAVMGAGGAPDGGEGHVREAMRLVCPGGWMLVHFTHPVPDAQRVAETAARGLATVTPVPDASEGAPAFVLMRLADDKPGPSKET